MSTKKRRHTSSRVLSEDEDAEVNHEHSKHLDATSPGDSAGKGEARERSSGESGSDHLEGVVDTRVMKVSFTRTRNFCEADEFGRKIFTPLLTMERRRQLTK